MPPFVLVRKATLPDWPGSGWAQPNLVFVQVTKLYKTIAAAVQAHHNDYIYITSDTKNPAIVKHYPFSNDTMVYDLVKREEGETDDIDEEYKDENPEVYIYYRSAPMKTVFEAWESWFTNLKDAEYALKSITPELCEHFTNYVVKEMLMRPYKTHHKLFLKALTSSVLTAVGPKRYKELWNHLPAWKQQQLYHGLSPEDKSLIKKRYLSLERFKKNHPSLDSTYTPEGFNSLADFGQTMFNRTRVP